MFEVKREKGKGSGQFDCPTNKQRAEEYTGQNKTKQNETKQNRAKQNSTKQNETGRNETKQNKARSARKYAGKMEIVISRLEVASTEHPQTGNVSAE